MLFQFQAVKLCQYKTLIQTHAIFKKKCSSLAAKRLQCRYKQSTFEEKLGNSKSFVGSYLCIKFKSKRFGANMTAFSATVLLLTRLFCF